MTKQPNTSTKSKELQPIAQSQSFAAHLLLPRPQANKFNQLANDLIYVIF